VGIIYEDVFAMLSAGEGGGYTVPDHVLTVPTCNTVIYAGWI